MSETPKDVSPFEDVTLEQRITAVEQLLLSHSHDGRETRAVRQNAPTVYTGDSVPTTTPKKIGDFFINLAAAKLYFAAGTSTSADWIITN